LQKILTEKERSFAAHFAQSDDALHAYKACYKCASYSDEGLRKKAEGLLNKPHIRSYIDRLKCVKSKQSSIEKERLTQMLLRAYEKAAEDKRGASAMISACLAIAKVNNLDDQENAGETLSDTNLSALIKEARRRLSADEPPTELDK
jgi:phage terminase small subunit